LAQAAARARATGRPVTATSLTTANSETVARPDGRFTTTVSLAPVRARVGTRWMALNPALHHAAGGRVTPALTAAPVTLSGGGPGPLATLGSYGRTLSVSWPGVTLPAPTLSGATATYPGVPVPGADLIVTVSPDGTVSTVIEVTTAATAGPALASLTFGTSSPGLTVTADSTGNMAWRASPAALPAFTATAPRMWDSAALPPGTATVTDPASGQVLAAGSGLPAASGPAGPGAAAHITAIPVTASGGTIALAPPASAVTGQGVTYPVYIDPSYAPGHATKDASAWTEINSGSVYDKSMWMDTGCLNGGSCLQSGFCDNSAPGYWNCGALQVTRTMLRLPLPAGLPTNLTVATADLYLENVWTPICSAEKVQFWTTPAISSNTDWSNASNWGSSSNNLEDESFQGYGNGSCGSRYGYAPNDVVFGSASGTKDGVSITGGSASALADTIQEDLDRSSPYTNQTFGLRASNESTTPNSAGGTAWQEWRQWMDKSSAIELQFTWYNPPNVPSDLSSQPGGACHTNAAAEAQIGNDDVTLYATAGDADGDTGLATKFRVYAVDGSNNGNPWDTITVNGTGPLTTPVIPRATIQSWQGPGAWRYYYTVTTTNQDGQSTSSASCYFLYNSSGPSAPQITGFPSAVTLGQTVTGVTFAPGTTGCPGPSTCPASYAYQLGTAAPVTVSSSSLHGGSWNSGNDSWTGPVTVNSLGPLQLSVTATNGVGNPGAANTVQANSTSASPLADGYFAGGKYADVLFTGSGSKPSLWLAMGTGAGNLAAPADIGSLGNAINGGGAADGPGDWAGALIVHGDLTADHVQDVMAYWPKQTTVGSAAIPAGTGMILAGTGAPITIQPTETFWATTGPWQVQPVRLCDYILDGCVDEPGDLVAAGNASQQAPHPADLIGWLGDSTNHYELVLYTANTIGDYGVSTVLSPPTAVAPDGTNDWNNYTLATYQPPDAANPNGDPAATVLLALDNQTGALYQSANPNLSNPPTGQPCSTSPAQSVCTIIGSPGTWTPITTPWRSSPPALVSADCGNGANGPGSGAPQIWTQSGGALTAWNLSGTTLTKAATTSIASPADDWPLTDGNPAVGGTATTPTATDTITGVAASITNPAWDSDATFRTVLDANGTSYTIPPANTLLSSWTAPSISLWFNTTTPDGVLASIQNQALTAGSTIPVGYNPVLYIGNDGKLYAEWWTAHVSPISSSGPVDDGLWHHVVLTTSTDGTTQTLNLDGTNIGTLTGTVSLGGIGNPTNLSFGAGYIGGDWPNENYYRKNGNTGYLDYLNGQIADITLTH